MKNYKYYIGIDPDVDKSGVAFLNGNHLELNNLTFFDLFDYLINHKKEFENLQVYIECGFLNGGNRHLKLASSHSLNSKIGERIGANHETAKKIIEINYSNYNVKISATQDVLFKKGIFSLFYQNFSTFRLHFKNY